MSVPEQVADLVVDEVAAVTLDVAVRARALAPAHELSGAPAVGARVDPVREVRGAEAVVVPGEASVTRKSTGPWRRGGTRRPGSAQLLGWPRMACTSRANFEPRDDDARLDLDQVPEHGPAAGARVTAAHDEQRALPARCRNGAAARSGGGGAAITLKSREGAILASAAEATARRVPRARGRRAPEGP